MPESKHEMAVVAPKVTLVVNVVVHSKTLSRP